ncbi:MAG: hypothetical protein AAB019_09375 [Planctomycetota bacterium]
MILLFVLGFVVVFFSFVAVILKRERKRIEDAFKEYDELVKKYGSFKAREHCLHKVIKFEQTGIPGVVTTTTKWCKVCHEYLGPAKLKTSIFGNRWE